MSNTWADEQNQNTKGLICVKRDMSDIGGGQEYIDHFLNALQIPRTRADNLYAYFCYLFGLYPLETPIFSPCAVFCVTYNGQIPLRTLHTIHKTIDGVHAKNDYFVSKVLASIIERLWYTLFMHK